MRWWKKPTEDRTDVHEVRALRAAAAEDMAELREQAPYVSRLTARLIERRALNHFGDDIQITFTPRGTHG